MLVKLLVSDNTDGVLEAVHVFGNLSQDRTVCDFIVRKNRELLILVFLAFLASQQRRRLSLGHRHVMLVFDLGGASALHSVPYVVRPSAQDAKMDWACSP